MLVSRTVWFFIVIAVFLATTASSKQVYKVDRQNEGPSFARGGQSPLGAELEQKLLKGTVVKSVYQVPPKEAPLNGPNNETEFTGKRINTEIVSDSKRYPKNPTGVTVTSNFRPLPQEQTQDVAKKTFKGLAKIARQLEGHKYNHKIFNELSNTEFVRGMFTGKLDLNNHLRFKLQNIVYLNHVAKIYALAGNEMQIQGKQKWFEFYDSQSKKHQDLYDQACSTYKVNGEEGVVKGPAVKLYMDYLTVVATDHPQYLPIAMLPCSTYWSRIANSLNEDGQPMNVFKQEWIQKNMRRPGELGSTYDFVAKHYTEEEDFKLALFYFCKASVAELNTFQEAGGESLTEHLDIFEACRNGKLNS